MSELRSYRRTKLHRRKRHRILVAFLWLLLLCVYALLALRLLPVGVGDSRAVPELISFLPWTAFPAALVCILGFICRRRALPACAALALALLVWWHAGYLIPAATVSAEAQAVVSSGVSTDDTVVRVMTLNTKNGGADPNELVSAVRDNNVEVLCLQEVTTAYLEELEQAGLMSLLPNMVVSEVGYVSNGGRNCVLSVAPMSDTSSDLLPIITSSMAACSIEVAGQTLRFVSVHTNSPHLGGHAWWADGLSTIADLAAYDHSYIICGDFNATWDHARFRALLGDSFVDAGEQAGEGFHMTYPANSALPALIEIDHVVYSADASIAVGDLSTLEISGTDHRALLVTIEVTG